MWLHYITVLCSLLVFVTKAQNIRQIFSSAGILDNVLSRPPARVLKVEYPGNVSVDLGNTLSIAKTQEQPRVQFEESIDIFSALNVTKNEGSLYTLAMVDPDAPSRKNPRAAQWNHWIVTDIKSTDVKSLGKVSGKVVTSYNPPSPPKGSGPHRYIILLYKQHGGVVGKVSHNRANFNVTRWRHNPLLVKI